MADAIQEYGLGDLIRDEWHYWLEKDDYNWQTALWKASLKRLKEFLSSEYFSEYDVELDFDINGPELARAINSSGLPRMVMD